MGRFRLELIYLKKNTTIEWDDGGKIGNKNKLIPRVWIPVLHNLFSKQNVFMTVTRYLFEQEN